MGEPSKHPKSIVLDHCWICGARFVGKGGVEQREDHHIIPCAYGGVDGPTVTLCTTHHSKLHDIAVARKSGRNYQTSLMGEPPQNVKHLLWLANQVVNAELAVRNDPNKAASVTITLNARGKMQVDQLKHVYPKARSREAILLLALEHLYSKHFVTK